MNSISTNRANRRRQEREIGQRVLRSPYPAPTWGFGFTVTNNIVAILLFKKSVILWERKNVVA